MKTFIMALAIWCVAAMPAAAQSDPLDRVANMIQNIVGSSTHSPSNTIDCYATKAQARRAHPTEHLWYTEFQDGMCWHTRAYQHTASHNMKPSHSKRGSVTTKCSESNVELPSAKPQRIKYIPETYDWQMLVKNTSHYSHEPPQRY